MKFEQIKKEDKYMDNVIQDWYHQAQTITQNNKIDNGNEIFGDNYIKQDDSKATSGFNALSDLDSNNDGIINSNDEMFNDIKIEKNSIMNKNLSTMMLDMHSENGHSGIFHIFYSNCVMSN